MLSKGKSERVLCSWSHVTMLQVGLCNRSSVFKVKNMAGLTAAHEDGKPPPSKDRKSVFSVMNTVSTINASSVDGTSEPHLRPCKEVS